jgi:hypothetical protein
MLFRTIWKTGSTKSVDLFGCETCHMPLCFGRPCELGSYFVYAMDLVACEQLVAICALEAAINLLATLMWRWTTVDPISRYRAGEKRFPAVSGGAYHVHLVAGLRSTKIDAPDWPCWITAGRFDRTTLRKERCIQPSISSLSHNGAYRISTPPLWKVNQIVQ